MRALKVWVAVVVMVVGTTRAMGALTIGGPTLGSPVMGWPDAGIQFTTLKEVKLVSFVFRNQGLADTITLSDEGNNVLYTLDTPANTQAYMVSPRWVLPAGTYQLTAANDSNGKYAEYSAFPVGNEHVRVDGGIGWGMVTTDYWYSFADLTTVVPTPGAMWGGIVLMGVMGVGRRRKS